MAKRLQKPQDHHFNPAFSLWPWAEDTPDKRLLEIRKIYGKIVTKRVSPVATGFERNLYRTEGVAAEDEQHLEQNFFSPLDNDAAIALQKILARDRTKWSEEMRSAWTRYILSLIFRTPRTVSLIKRHIANMWDVGVKDLKEHYVDRRKTTDPASFDEYMAKTHAAAPHIAATNLLTKFIDNDRIGPVIFDMHWSSVDLSASNRSLLFSDRPLNRPMGLSDPRAYIAFPVSPRMIFVASKDPRLGDSIGNDNPTKIVKLINKSIVQKAVEYVWANDSSQLAFVRKYMGAQPDQDVITDDQRDAAIEASRPKFTGE